MIPLNEVPQEVFEEIKSHYPSTDLSEYGSTTVKENWRLRKLSFQQKLSDELVEARLLDPLTFEPKLVTGIPYKMFIVRGVFNDELGTATVHQIVDAGNTIRN